MIDCESRLHLCRAACCKLYAVPGVYRPGKEPHCRHLTGGMRCAIYKDRPGECRTFDCSEDKRIWLDFEGRIPNPELKDMLDARDR